MAEYIDKQAAIDALTEQNLVVHMDSVNDGLVASCHRSAQRIIANISAADVRPVVTCGKCKYGKYTGTEWFCDKHSGHADKLGEDASYHEYHSKHWFCADGDGENMSEYIDRCKLIEEGWHLQKTVFRDDCVHIERASLLDIPTADVRPVVNGKWEDETGFIFSDLSQQVRCSKCGLIAYFYDKMPMNFCPNCGADMRGKS